MQAQFEGMQSTLRAIASKRPHESEREESVTEDTLQRPGHKEQYCVNKWIKTIFKNIVSCKDEPARVVEEARKGMESGEDRNLTIRIADSDGRVVAKKPLVESEEDSRRLREVRQGSNVRERQEYHGTVSEGSGSRHFFPRADKRTATKATVHTKR